MKVSSMLDGFRLYFSLSREGRAYLRVLARTLPRRTGGKNRELVRNTVERRKLMDNIRTCDRFFGRIVTREACRIAEKNRKDLYARYNSFAWINLALRTRTLDAFGIPYDKQAEERSVLLAFIHREFNDLVDEGKHPVEVLSQWHADPEDGPGDLYLLRTMYQLRNREISTERFPNFWKMFDMVSTIIDRGAEEKNMRAHTEARSHCATMFHLRAMNDDVPADMDRALRSQSLWFYSLDDISDLDRDRKLNRQNWIATTGDPVGTLWELYEQSEKDIRQHAVKPDSVLFLMKYVTGRVIAARTQKIDVEGSYFGGDK
ncbi:MAG: hypothetical protein HQ559_04155 [Lentisphaerae bacterium]|nr:hypothetical protein [Lentisphaerota bacterium]